jgi:hypothetical protein
VSRLIERLFCAKRSGGGESKVEIRNQKAEMKRSAAESRRPVEGRLESD